VAYRTVGLLQQQCRIARDSTGGTRMAVIRNYCIPTPIVGQLASSLGVYIRHSTGHL